MMNFKLNRHNNTKLPSFERQAKNNILFTNVRDEKHIVEWVAFHLNIGFSMIIIFDHKSKIPVKTLFKQNPRVKVLPCFDDGAIKLPLMRSAVKIAIKFKADWMLYLDADEFLYLNKYNNIKEMLEHHFFADLLGINWVMFGSNNLINDPEPNKLLIESYTKSEGNINAHIKAFVRPLTVVSVTNAHFYNIRNNARSYAFPYLKNLNPPNPFNHITIPYTQIGAFIAHYVYQSQESYNRRKVQLPADDTGIVRGVIENIHENYNDVDNFLVSEKYSNNVREIIKLL